MKFVTQVFTIILLGVFFQCTNKSERDKNLVGKKEKDATDLYGSASSIKLFIISDSLEAYETNLIKLFPAYKTDTIRIKELIWQKGNEKTVFWLTQKDSNWIVVDNLSWDSNKVKL